MSRLIKSTFITRSEPEKKQINLRSVSPRLVLANDPKSETLASEKKLTSHVVHYNEQKEIQAQKEQLADEVLAFEKKQQAWLEEKQQQQLELEEIIAVKASQAAEDGYNQGYTNAVDEVKQEYSALIQQAKDTVDIAKADYLTKVQESESVILELALSIAEKIIRRTLSENDASWLELLKKAVSEVREHEEIKVYVHPSWYEMTLFHKKELQDIALHTRDLLIYPDEHLDENGCVIETPFGQMNASLDSQLVEIKKSLFEKLKEGTKGEY